MVQDAWPIPTPATTYSCLDRISGQWVAGLLLFKPQIAHVHLASKMGKKKKHVLFTSLLYPISTQLQDNYSKIGLACFSKEDGDFWDSTDEGILNRPCLQVKRQLYQLIEEVGNHYSKNKEFTDLQAWKSVFGKQRNQVPGCLCDSPTTWCSV